MPVRTISVDELKPSAYNPRVDLLPDDPRYQRIKRSLDRFGLVSPLVWNERSGNLVGGHQRLKILKAEGATEVDVNVVDLDDNDEKALNLVLNSPDIEGEWDKTALDKVLGELEASAPDVFDEMELNLLNRLEIETDAELAAKAEKEAKEDEPEPTGPAAMELLPYEHYDYVVLMYRDSRDFLAALDHFQLQKVRVPDFVGSKKIGLGRVLDGAKYHARIRALHTELDALKAQVKALMAAGTTPPPVDDQAAPESPEPPLPETDDALPAEDEPRRGRKKK